jgi:TRAP-type mannitol/chloroaromatic compound transport system permease large subunit
MAWYEAFGLMIGAVLALMMMGLPVALAFIAANIVGAFVFLGGERGIAQLINNSSSALTSFALVPVPLFLLMGELFFHTGLASRVFDAIDKLMGRVPARLSFVTVAGGTAFAALSGSSMASTAMLGSLMVPEMARRGYARVMSVGPIMGVGGLAMLIPPSALAVLLGTLARIDVGQLLIAGVVPGLILAGLYALLILVLVTAAPHLAPAYEVAPTPLLTKLRVLVTEILPMGFVVPGGRPDPPRLGDAVGSGGVRCGGRPDPGRGLPLPDPASARALGWRRAQGDGDVVHDHSRLGDLQPNPGVLRRICRHADLGDRV